jgi:phospholipase C
MGILPNIQHIVVVMLENRSFDNICGWLYNDAEKPGLHYIRRSDDHRLFNGLDPAMWCPSNRSYFNGQPPTKVLAKRCTKDYTVPNPDPEETFDNVTYQLYGPEGAVPNPQWPMQGFIVNYEDATSTKTADMIMEAYCPEQLPVISTLARSYAVSDEWFCSVPSQTWPNRCFFHAGNSNGHVNNGDIPDPLEWDVETIYNVLESLQVSWKVYSDTWITPSATRTMYPKLWDPDLDDHFCGFGDFKRDCAHNSLPKYSFLEPSFLFEPSDEHPPHDVAAGEHFLFQIWQAVSESPGWNDTLLMITYDEHGGCYDHVLPEKAIPPDSPPQPGDEGFLFDRFGVRVPTVLVSPYIQAGTVFRSDTAVPYDHTSILATLRDWLEIPEGDMLPSNRIKAAPHLGKVLTLTTQRTDKPSISPPYAGVHLSLDLSLNDFQRSLVTGSARRFAMHPGAVLAQVKTRKHAMEFFKSRASSHKH